MATCLATRDGSQPETDRRSREYYRALVDLDEADFIEACDRILYSDEWFPSIARIRSVAEECGADRRRRTRIVAAAIPAPAKLVCGTCRGARFVRTGGYDPLGGRAGETGSRVQACPKCTVNGRYDEATEARGIFYDGGVPDPDATHEVDRDSITWPQRMDELRDPATGRIDMDALYRLSREMRGLDPDVDERPAAVGGWRTLAQTH